MKREILFRGLKDDVSNCYFIYGLLDYDSIGQPIIKQGNGVSNYCIGSTIGQFTGLLDKNGVKIFEGDIIKYTQHYFNTPMTNEKTKEVEWGYDRWNIFSTNAGETNIEVIGNIHEKNSK